VHACIPRGDVRPQSVCRWASALSYESGRTGRREKEKLPRDEKEVGEKEKRERERKGVDEDNRESKIRKELMKIIEGVGEEGK
jgi:hypothetical protein